MDNRDVAGNSPLLLSGSSLGPRSYASPLRPLTESTPTRRSSSASGRPEATGSAPPPPTEVSYPVAIPHTGPGLLRALGLLGFCKSRHRVCLASAFRKINHLRGSSELRSPKQRQPWTVLRPPLRSSCLLACVLLSGKTVFLNCSQAFPGYINS